MSTSTSNHPSEQQTRSLEADRKILFRGLTLGPLVLANRIVMAPMTRGRSPGGVPTAQVAAYYRRRAEGGVGLIITEGTHLAHESSCGYPNVPILAGKERLAGWKKVVEAVHKAGGNIFPQLWHTGSFYKPGFDRGSRILRLAPSAVAHPGFGDEPHIRIPKRMSLKEIDDIIASFAEAAAQAMAVGFDGVEIHGAHGYLIDQFFWEATNRRLDQYGGSLSERARFACEVVRAVRRATRADYPVCFRFSNWKVNAYDDRGAIFHNPQELEHLLALLNDAGVDIFHASSRRFYEPAFAGSALSLAGWTKKLSGKPTIAVGSIGLTADFMAERQGAGVGPCSIDQLLEYMKLEEFDLVAIGRALLADPQWANKICRHEDGEIIPYHKSCLATLF